MRKVYRTIERGVALSQEINARGVTNVTLLSAVVDSNTGTTSPLTSAAFTLTSEGFRILVPSNLLTSDVTNIEIRYNSNAIVSLEVSLKAVETGTGGAVASVVGRTGVVTGAHIASDVALSATYGPGGTAGNARQAPDWTTGRAYVVGELVVSGGTLYRCTTAHTSGASIAPGNFAALGASSGVLERVILPVASTFGGGAPGTWLAANKPRGNPGFAFSCYS